MTLLLKEIREALTTEANGLKCPFTAHPPKGAVTHEVPEDIRHLLALYQKRSTKAVSLLKDTNPQDGGHWFRNKQRAEAVECIIIEALQAKHHGTGQIEQKVIYYWSDWRYSFS